jgi:hypothetical protein
MAEDRVADPAASRLYGDRAVIVLLDVVEAQTSNGAARDVDDPSSAGATRIGTPPVVATLEIVRDRPVVG